MRIAGEESEPCIIGRGVRQGCCRSPVLFNIYSEAMIREAMEDTESGVKVGGKVVKSIRFADDKAIIASSEVGLQDLIDRLVESGKGYGMKINNKTKVMVITKTQRNIAININGTQLEQVRNFKYMYLGSTLSSDARCGQDIRNRIAIGKEHSTERRKY